MQLMDYVPNGYEDISESRVIQAFITLVDELSIIMHEQSCLHFSNKESVVHVFRYLFG